MATLSFRCRDDRTGEDGAPVHLRISHNGTRRYVSTGLRVDPDKWRGDNVTRSHNQAAEINAGLQRIQSTAQKALTSLQTSGAQVTADRAKSEIEDALNPAHSGDLGFVEFCEDRIQSMYDKRSTRRSHKSAVVKLREFLRQTRDVDDIPLSPRHINASLLEEMQTWESEKRGNSTNTIHKTMRSLRRMINVAIREDLFPKAKYPFDDMTLTREETNNTALNKGEVDKLEQLMEKINAGETNFTSDGVAADGLRVFLFSIYMLGLRWSDASTLEWSQIRNGRMEYVMAKTGTQKDVKIVPPAKEILGWYSDRKENKRFVFPLVERYAHKYDLSDNEGLSAARVNMNRRVNQELKEIADAAGIDVSLSTHNARHTSAQKMLKEGWNLHQIQAALGHKSLSTTETYLRTVRDEELDDLHEGLW